MEKELSGSFFLFPYLDTTAYSVPNEFQSQMSASKITFVSTSLLFNLFGDVVSRRKLKSPGPVIS
jgi:hypothetical protein